MMVSLAFFSFLPFGTSTIEDPALRKEIQGVYERWNSATQKGEIKAVLAMVHPDMEYFTPLGTENYKDFCAHVSFAIAHSRNMKIKASIEKVDGYDKEAIAWTTYSISAEFQQGKQWIPFSQKLNLIDTFVKTSRGWLIRSSRIW